MKKQLLIVLFIFPLILNCNRNDKSETDFYISVVNDFFLSEETNNFLFNMYPLIIDNPESDELAFSNFNSPIQIVITDYSGEFKEKVGSEGFGPGELQSARYFGFDEIGNIVIDDKPAAFIKIFERSTYKVAAFDSPIRDGISIVSRNMQMCNGYWYLGILHVGKQPFPEVPTIGKFDREFNLIDVFGGYDPYFEGRSDFMQESLISVDCENGIIYSTHGKTPFIQLFSIQDHQLIHRISNKPENFMLSGKFMPFVTNPRDVFRYLSEEQSTSSLIAHSDLYIYHIYRNEKDLDLTTRGINDRIYYVAVYDKNTFSYLGETKLNGAVLGFTKNGNLILLINEEEGHIQFIDLNSSNGNQELTKN